MTHRSTTRPTPQPRPRRRRPRPLNIFSAVPDFRTAEAMDDRDAAEQLMTDLLALIDAGLITPLAEGSEVRYAPAEDDSDFDNAA